MQLTKRIFKNGLRLIVAPQKESPSATVTILVEAGTAYENKKNNGISHFLEHMCFKGTARRPTPFAISSEMESLGAFYNAFTSRDLTGYWAKVAYPKLEKIFDILSDMYLNPLFNEEEIEKEKGVIIEEINMYEDQPRSKVSEALDALMYGDQPAGWDVAGLKENISRFKKEDFLNYRFNHYHSKKTIISVAGRVDTKQVENLVKKFFSQIKKRKRISPFSVLDSQKSPALSLVKRKLDQTHLAFGFKAFPLLSDKKYPLIILSEILGGGMSSRLFQKIREKMGAAYYIGSSPYLFLTHGYLKIAAGVNHQKSEIVIKSILEELRKIVENGVSSEELKRAKDYFLGNFLLSLETSSDLAFFFGEQEAAFKKVELPTKIIKKISAVTEKSVQKIAQEIFRNERLNLAIIGPYKNDRIFKKHLKI